MCCGILLVLHVDIKSSVCYTMVVNLFLSSLVVDGRKRGRRKEGGEQREEEESGPLSKLFNSCRFVFC